MTIAGREAEIFVAGDSVVLVESTDPLKDTHCWLTPEAKWSPFPEQAVKFLNVDAAQTFLYENADKPTPPAEPPADAGKMVAVGERRKWTQAIIDLAADIREVDGGHSLGAAELAEKLIERGWHPTTAETERLRGECERLTERLSLLGDVPDPHENTLFGLSAHHTWHHQQENKLTAELTTLREQLAAAERTISLLRGERDDMRVRNQILRKRSDIPLHRTQDYERIDKHLTELRAENTRLQAELAAAGAKGGA